MTSRIYYFPIYLQWYSNCYRTISWYEFTVSFTVKSSVGNNVNYHPTFSTNFDRQLSGDTTREQNNNNIFPLAVLVANLLLLLAESFDLKIYFFTQHCDCHKMIKLVQKLLIGNKHALDTTNLKLLTNQKLTNYMEQRPSWKDDSRSASHNIPRILWNLKNHLCPQKPGAGTKTQSYQSSTHHPTLFP
jgi:hypothetical protein